MESRRLYDVVHLEGLRCGGSAHGGCQAQCFLYWKEAWLNRVKAKEDSMHALTPGGLAHSSLRFDRSRLKEVTRQPQLSKDSEIFYRCQATDLLKASKSLPWWDFRQYLRDVWSGNVGVMD